jgi:excisionase family DNA binding protein
MQQIEVASFNVREAAKYIGISPPSVLRLLHEKKEIPFKRVGKRVLIPKAAIDKWLEGNDVGEDKQ